MNGWRDQLRRGMDPRTYLLLAILVVAIVWVQSLDGRLRAARVRPAAAGAAVPAESDDSPGAVAGARDAESAEPRGWGRDPFDPRF